MALRKTNVFTPLTQFLTELTDTNITVKNLADPETPRTIHLPANADGWECLITEDKDREVSLHITNAKWGGTYDVTVRIPRRDGKLIQPPPYPVRKRKL